MWTLYDTLLRHLPEGRVESVVSTEFWTLAKTVHYGLAMTTEGETRPAQFSSLEGLSVRQAAEGVKSWNLMEASQAMAVINSCYNTPQRLALLQCAEPFERYCTHGLDVSGKTVGVVGHLRMPEDALRLAKDVFILERHPRPGDYPDSACEYLLPKCDVVLITGSSLVNKTLPRLLQLCRSAYTILTGPTVPMCPELLELGIDRLAGLVPTDTGNLKNHVEQGLPGSVYKFGTPFLLK